MVEDLALPEDRELLAPVGAARLAEVEEDLAAIERDHRALDRLRGLDEVVCHEAERGAHAVGQSGGRWGGGERGQREDESDDACASPQNVTDGRCTPKTPRRRSQISPSVAAASTASTIRVRRLSEPRAPRSSASSARPAAAPSRAERNRAMRSASASPSPASSWKGTVGCSSADT